MEGVTLIDQMRIDEEERGTIVQAKYRSMISYDCDGDICPDPEVVAFSSGLRHHLEGSYVIAARFEIEF